MFRKDVVRAFLSLSIASVLSAGSNSIYATPDIESLGPSPQPTPSNVRPVAAESMSDNPANGIILGNEPRQLSDLSWQLGPFGLPVQRNKAQLPGNYKQSAVRLGLNSAADRKKAGTQAHGSHQYSISDLEEQLIALNTSIASVAGNGVVPDPIQRRDMAALKAEIKTLSAKASDPSAVSVKYLRNGSPSRITGSFPLPAKGKSVADRVRSFLGENLEVLGFNTDTQFEIFDTCNADLCIFKVKKFVGSLPIFGDSFTVIVKGDDVISLSGRYDRVPAGGQIYTSSLPSSDIENIIRRHLELGSVVLDRPLEVSSGFRRISGTYRAVYKVRVVVSLTKAWDVFISRQSGEVLDALTLVYEQSSVASQGVDLTNTPRAFFSRQVTANLFELIDDSFPEKTGEFTKVYDAQNELDWDTYLRPVFSESSTDGWDPTAVSALHNNRQAYDYFLESFGRRGLTGNDDSMHTIVHVVYENDDGTTHGENASYSDFDGGLIMYGDGGSRFGPLAKSLDVAGHELAHGVVSHTAGLEYRFQSGALNESFADFFGAQIDRDDWLIGEDVVLNGDCGGGVPCLRSMSNPGAGNQPGHMNDYQVLPESFDKGGVHINSGIPNRAMYLLAEGMPNSLGRDETEQIAYYTLLALNPYSDFDEAAAQMYEIAGLRSVTAAEATRDAWLAVGIDVDPSDDSGEEIPVEGIDSAANMGIAYLYRDEQNNYIPYLQGIDFQNPNYTEAQDVIALFLDSVSSNSRMSIIPDAGNADYGRNKGFFATYVDSTSNQIHADYIDADPDAGAWGATGTAESQSQFSMPVQNVALSPNYGADARYAVTFQDANVIYVVSGGSVFGYEVNGPDYSEDGTGTYDVALIDSLRWDPSGRKLVFDYASCLPDAESGECSYTWSVAILNAEIQGKSAISYPFPGQPSHIDLGFPAFTNLSDRYITMDYHQYSEEDGSAQYQLIAVYDLYEGMLYNSGITVSDCEASSLFWSAPSFTADDSGYIHTGCKITEDGSTIKTNFVSQFVDSDSVSVAVNDYAAELPFAVPAEPYHIESELKFSPANIGDGSFYVGEVAYGSSGSLSDPYCLLNTKPVKSQISSKLEISGLDSSLIPSSILPGEEQCGDVSITPPLSYFRNDPGLGYASKLVSSDAPVTGGIIYTLISSSPSAPALGLLEATSSSIRLSVNEISSGGDPSATLSIDCGDFSASLPFSAVIGVKSSPAAYYEYGISIGFTDLPSNTSYQCEAHVANEVTANGGTVFISDKLDVATLKLDTDADGVTDDVDEDDDGDGVEDELDAFPLDPSESQDTDGDGIGNNSDTDDDNDGIDDAADAFPLDPNEWADADNDGIGDNEDDLVSLACSASDYDLTTQDEVDTLADEGCNVISGTLRILHSADITDLSGLIGIERVGSLEVFDNAQLQNIDGLSGIQGPVERLHVRHNDLLTNLDGLAGITMTSDEPESTVLVEGNPQLLNVDGLAGLTSIGDSLDIRENDSLVDVGGLSNVSRIGGWLVIASNHQLTDITSLSGLDDVPGNLMVSGDSLADISGLSNIVSVGGYLHFSCAGSETQVSDLSGFASLTTVGAEFAICPSNLTSLSGLEQLREVGGSLQIEGVAIPNVDALNNLTTLNGDLIIQSDALTNLDGLSSLSTIGGDQLVISSNSLTDCRGLAPILGWPSGEGAPSQVTLDAAADCASPEAVLASVNGPTESVITGGAFLGDVIQLNFEESIRGEDLFPVMGYEAACTGAMAQVSGDYGIAIADESQVQKTLTISDYDPVSVSSVIKVSVDITHSDPSDLYISLTSPQGSTVVLWDQGANSGENLVGVFPDNLSPVDSLASIADEPMDGEWTLTVEDRDVGPIVREGVLNSWGIEVKETLVGEGSGNPVSLSESVSTSAYSCRVTTLSKLGAWPESQPFKVADLDQDGIQDSVDNCPQVANSEQGDNDLDDQGDLCDADDDNDGFDDIVDDFPFDASESLDSDGDGIGNNADADDDGDGVADADDAFPLDASETIDTDSDGIGNND